jgi:probable rRNA maturation factor
MTADHAHLRPAADRNVRAPVVVPRRAPRRLRTLALCNRQHVRPVDLRLLRRIVQGLLHEVWPHASYDLAVNILTAPEMTRLNEMFLRHTGSTDVITFDYADRVGQASRLSQPGVKGKEALDRRDACPALLHGELFVCIDEAVSQARRFHARWQGELVRYVVHGVLHLLGYDDLNDAARRAMKHAEDTLVRRLSRQFHFQRLTKRRDTYRA